MADVLRRTTRSRVNMTKNALPMYTQEHFKEDVTFTESVHNRVVLATNGAQQEIDITNVTTGSGTPAVVLQLETDRAIAVAIDTAANTVQLADNGVIMMVGTFTHVFVQNSNTTFTATVEVIVTD